MANDVDVAVKLLGDATSLIRAMKQGERQAKGFLNKLQSHNAQLRKMRNTAGIAFAAIAGGIGFATKAASGLEDEIANALTLVDVQGAEFDAMASKMEASAIKMSKKLGISAKDIASSFYQVLSAGADVTSDSFESFTETALKMAKVTGLSTSDAVERLNDVINAFNLNLGDAERVADVFLNASKKTAVTVPQLAEAFKEAGGTAAVFGFELEETAAILDGFAAKGIKGTDAGTAFKIMAVRLAAPVRGAADVIEKLGLRTRGADLKMRPMLDILVDLKKKLQDVTPAQKDMALATLFGQRAVAKIGGLLSSNLNTIARWRDEISQGTGVQEAFNKKLNTLSGQLGVLKAELTAVILPIGKTFIPLIIKLVKNISPVLTKMAKWVTENKKLVGILLGIGVGGAGLIAALAAIGLILPQLAIGFALATGPVGIFALAFITLATAITAAVMAADQVPDSLEDINKELEANEKKLKDLEAQELKNVASTKKLNASIDKLPTGYREANTAAARLEGTKAKLQKRIDTLTEAKDRLIESEKKEAEVRRQLQEVTDAQKAALDALNDATETNVAVTNRAAERTEFWATTWLTVGVGVIEMQRQWAEQVERTMRAFNMLPVVATGAGERIIEVLEDMTTAQRNFVSSFWAGFNSMTDVMTQFVVSGKNLMKGFYTSIGAGLLAAVGQAAEGAIIEILITKLKETAKALMMGPLSFGASLAALAPIAIAGAAGIAAIRGVQAQFAKKNIPSFERGGIVQQTGVANVHEGEVFVNPQFGPTPEATTALAGMGGLTIQMFNYGTISGDKDMQKFADMIGKKVRRARTSGL